MRVLRTLAALVGRMFGRLARLLPLWSRGTGGGRAGSGRLGRRARQRSTGALDPYIQQRAPWLVRGRRPAPPGVPVRRTASPGQQRSQPVRPTRAPAPLGPASERPLIVQSPRAPDPTPRSAWSASASPGNPPCGSEPRGRDRRSNRLQSVVVSSAADDAASGSSGGRHSLGAAGRPAGARFPERGRRGGRSATIAGREPARRGHAGSRSARDPSCRIAGPDRRSPRPGPRDRRCRCPMA